MLQKQGAVARRTFVTLSAVLVVPLLGAALSAPANAQSLEASQQSERTRYIIVFKPGSGAVKQHAESLANGSGTRPDHVYELSLIHISEPTRPY